MKKQILLLITIGILFSCSNDDGNESKTIEMRINHYQNTGIAVGPVLTLLVQEGDAIGTTNWSKFYSNIEGFNYVPGKIYNLTVKVESIKKVLNSTEMFLRQLKNMGWLLLLHYINMTNQFRF